MKSKKIKKSQCIFYAPWITNLDEIFPLTKNQKNKIMASEIIMYATADKGEGRVMEIGRFEEVSDIEIIVGMFDKDTIISFHEEYEKENESP